MKQSKSIYLTTLISGLLFTGIVHAGLFSESFLRISPNQTSGDGTSTVLIDCGGGVEGWESATATLKISQGQGSTGVEISVKDARPDTLYDVWLRMRGTGPDGAQIGSNGSPLTGGGATALAPGSELDNLIAITLSPGSTTSPSGFKTDSKGTGKLKLILDFPLIGGAYPFHYASEDAVTDLINSGRPGLRIPSPVVNTNDVGIDGPYTLRIVSHCQDELFHGLSPGVREAWFDWPE